jgi:mono/diheme cytochrome c family protein
MFHLCKVKLICNCRAIFVVDMIGIADFLMKRFLSTPLLRGLLSLGAILPKVAAGEQPVTFNRDIAPIVFENCLSCHRRGEVAPFPLTNYTEVKNKAETIASALSDKVMPPWRADEGTETFHDARALKPEQIALFQRWLEQEMPEGVAADLPVAPKFPEGWMLGAPDLVLEPDQAYNVGPEGRDVYQCFVVPTNFTEDRYVSAVQVRPGNTAVVHHVILYLDTSGRARQLDAATPEPGYTSFGGPGFPPVGTLGGWAPGNFPRMLPDGVGVRLPKGADVVIQVHYHRTGKPEVDRTQVGLYFAKTRVEKRMRVYSVRARQLRIPPGEANYQTEGFLPLPADVTLLQIMPHMHLLGREMTVTARLPDGTEKKLVRVPDWDFNWQTTYRFKEPVKLPRGTVIHLTARFDNSEANPHNPSKPPRFVTFGEGTTDEMCMAFLYYTVDAENIAKGNEMKGFPDTFAGGGKWIKLLTNALSRIPTARVNPVEPLTPITPATP